MTEQEKLFQDPQPELPRLGANALLVLRRVKASDPFRDKAPGIPGKKKRLETLRYLQLRGLIRQNRSKLWVVTPAGRKMLAAHPIR
jgi:hypothetical protein